MLIILKITKIWKWLPSEKIFRAIWGAFDTAPRNTNQKANSCFSSLQNCKKTIQAEQLHGFQHNPFIINK